jgi:hypothetical protein
LYSEAGGAAVNLKTGEYVMADGRHARVDPRQAAQYTIYVAAHPEGPQGAIQPAHSTPASADARCGLAPRFNAWQLLSVHLYFTWLRCADPPYDSLYRATPDPVHESNLQEQVDDGVFSDPYNCRRLSPPGRRWFEQECLDLGDVSRSAQSAERYELAGAN